MAEANIETLKITFSTNAEQASKSIRTLADTLQNFYAGQTSNSAQILSNAIKSIANAVNSIDSTKITELNSFVGKLGSNATSAKKAAAAIGKINSEMVEATKAPATIPEKIDNVQEIKEEKEQKKEDSLAQKATKNIGKIALYRAVRQAITNIVQAMKEGYEYSIAWAQANNKELYQSVKNINGAVTNLKAAAGGIMANLAQIIEPFITKLSQGLVEISNYVSWISAAAGGMDTYTAYTYDATKATDGLKKSMLGVDEINTIGNSAGNGFTYVTKAVDDLGGLAGNSTIKTFFNDIKESFENASRLFNQLKQSTLWKTISSIVDRVIGVVHQLMPALTEGAKIFLETIVPMLEMVLGVLDAILGLVFNDEFGLTEILQGIIVAINTLVRAINIVIGAVAGIIGIALSAIGMKKTGGALQDFANSYLTSSFDYFTSDFSRFFDTESKVTPTTTTTTNNISGSYVNISTGYLQNKSNQNKARTLTTAY